MAFGSGVLVAALTFSLVEEAFNLSQSIPPVVIGFILGGTSYSVANRVPDKKSTTSSRSNSSNNSTGFLQATVRNRKRSHGENAGGCKSASGLSLLVGSVMDNIPENMALGISLVTGYESKWKKQKVHTCIMVYSSNSRNYIHSNRLCCSI
jgi:ZIP family zinc transporter